MTDDDQIRKFVIMRLMCDLDLDTRAVEKRFAIDFARYFCFVAEVGGGIPRRRGW